jgi:hypothetical protein
MKDDGRTFAVASDEALVGLISRARNRLVVIAPALTQPSRMLCPAALTILGTL